MKTYRHALTREMEGFWVYADVMDSLMSHEKFLESLHEHWRNEDYQSDPSSALMSLAHTLYRLSVLAVAWAVKCRMQQFFHATKERVS